MGSSERSHQGYMFAFIFMIASYLKRMLATPYYFDSSVAGSEGGRRNASTSGLGIECYGVIFNHLENSKSSDNRV